MKTVSKLFRWPPRTTKLPLDIYVCVFGGPSNHDLHDETAGDISGLTTI